MKFALTAATATALAVTALGFSAVAAAAPTATSSAADTVRSLEAKGYNVQINGAASRSLSECTVTGVHYGTTVYVDIACPSTG
jgi:hypothetical protein